MNAKTVSILTGTAFALVCQFAFSRGNQISMTTDPIPWDALDANCEKMAIQGKRLGLPPYCNKGARGGSTPWRQTKREHGGPARDCIQLSPPSAGSEGSYVFKTGSGWTSVGIAPFRLTYSDCAQLDAWIHFSGDGYENTGFGGWIALGKLQYGINYAVVHSQVFSDSDGTFGHVDYTKPPFNLPSAGFDDKVNITIWLCKDSTPSDGCAPKQKGAPAKPVTPQGALAAPRGIGRLAALLSYKPKTLAEKEFEGKPCEYFNCKPKAGEEAQHYKRRHYPEQFVCHQGEMYQCSKGGSWSYRHLCTHSPMGKKEVLARVSQDIEKDCSRDVASRSNRLDGLLAREQQREAAAKAQKAQARPPQQTQAPAPSAGGGANCERVYEETDREARAFRYDMSICSQYQARNDHYRRLADRVIQACGANSSEGKQMLSNMRQAAESYSNAVRNRSCR